MKLKIVLAIIFLLPLANASVQKPHWSIGDYWEYEGSYSVENVTVYPNASIQINIDSHDFNLKLEVVGVELKEIKGDYEGCYKTKLTASSSGDFIYKVEFGGKKQTITGFFSLEADGIIYFTTSNLSVYSNEITVSMNLTTDIPIPNLPSQGPLTLTTEIYYDPPLDFMQFPVEAGEKWTASSDVTIYTEDIEFSNETMTFSFECTKELGDTVVIKSDYNPLTNIIPLVGETTMFWSGSMGMFQSIRDTGGSQQLNVIVQDYRYEGKENTPPVANFTYSPLTPRTGDVIHFSSHSYDPDGSIFAYLWDFGDGSKSNDENPSHAYSSPGEYTVKLTVIDAYGDRSTTERKINVEGVGGGGNDSPGFEFIIMAVVLLLVFITKKIR